MWNENEITRLNFVCVILTTIIQKYDLKDNDESFTATQNDIFDTNFELRGMYPAINASYNDTIQLDSIHQLYFEEYRTSSYPNGKVALSLHGGPGAGSFPNHARFFSPDLYGTIILYDQRGCGKSKPKHNSENKTNYDNLLIQNNTLKHLVDDIETLRLHLGIDKWDLILGGSWGSTLALAYAQTYANLVKTMVLRGVCLFRNEEIDWLFSNQGMAKLNPSGWNSLEESVQTIVAENNEIESKESHRRTLHLLYHLMLGNDPIARFAAAKAWFQWEMSASSFHKQHLSANKNKTNEATTNNDINHVVIEWNPSQRSWFRIETSKDRLMKTQINDPSVDDNYKDLYQWKRQDNLGTTGTIVDDYQNLTNEELSIKPVLKLDNKGNITAILNLTHDQVSFATSFIPSQAMLTCFYSVNNEILCQDFSFLSSSTIQRVSDIPCIAIQGGKDHICPLDTAMDLNKAWPSMQLRIPLNAGHSMYDPAITHELVEATDFFGK